VPRLILPQCQSRYTLDLGRSFGASRAVGASAVVKAVVASATAVGGKVGGLAGATVGADTTGTTAKLSRLRRTHTIGLRSGLSVFPHKPGGARARDSFSVTGAA
jgi:hypothetical protein